MSKALQVTTTGSGKNLVFLHGWGVSSDVWQPTIVHLKSHPLCISTVDLPGYGNNLLNIPEPYTLQAIAELIIQCVPKKSVLVGWSLGGLVAQYLAFTYPEHFQQLVMVCSSPKFRKETEWPGIESNILHFFQQQLTQDVKKTLVRFMAIQSMGSANAKQDAKTIKQLLQTSIMPADIALQAGLDILGEVDLRDEMTQIQIPTTWFLGRFDNIVPVQVGDHLTQLNPKHQVEIIEDTSHAPLMTHAELFANRLLNCLV